MNAPADRLLLRTDASTEIGFGHLMRCVALGQAWAEQGAAVLFVCAELSPTLRQTLESNQFGLSMIRARRGTHQDAQETASISERWSPSWIVADGYSFDANYQEHLRNAGYPLMLIDDYGHLSSYAADLILNPNVCEESLYQDRGSHTQLMLGCQFALLRREFTQTSGRIRSKQAAATRVLVTMGGSDPDNVTEKVIQALSLLDRHPLDVMVVVGGSNPHYAALETAVGNVSYRVRLEQHSRKMPELMNWADLAVTAGGSTCWEMAYLGLPHVILVLAENQRRIAEHLAAEAYQINLGWHADCPVESIAVQLADVIEDRERRQIMSRAARQLIDGRGTRRVVQALRACA